MSCDGGIFVIITLSPTVPSGNTTTCPSLTSATGTNSSETCGEFTVTLM